MREQTHAFVGSVLNRLMARRGDRRLQQQLERAITWRLNIGCGAQPLPGWINTDIWWRAPARLDISQTWPIPDWSLDAIYADNVIEHVPLAVGRVVFENAYRVLKPGCAFRLATPDVERVARQYLAGDESTRRGLERNREKGRDLRYPVELLRTVYAEEGHYLGFCYDYASLSAELQAVGFTVERCEAGQSSRREFQGLEARVTEAERETMLVVEAVKD